MHQKPTISAVVPVLEDGAAAHRLLQEMPKDVDHVVVVLAAHLEKQASPLQGYGHCLIILDQADYGAACHAAAQALEPCDVVVFFSPTLTEDPREVMDLLEPLQSGRQDLVLGTPPRKAGARWLLRLLTGLIRWRWAVSLTDVQSFWAIRYTTLQWLKPAASSSAWMVGILLRAIQSHIPITEVPLKAHPVAKSRPDLAGLMTKVKLLLQGLAAMARVHLGRDPLWPRTAPDHLMIMSRYPQAGSTKTRLIPSLGAEGAARQHSLMIDHCLTWARQAQRQQRLSVELCYSSGRKAQWKARWGRDLLLRPQGKGDLGQKMRHAFQRAFKRGKKRVIMVGVDAVEMNAGLAGQALQSLNQHDLVLGPAYDGGYYLIGLTRDEPGLFQQVSWGSDQVLEQTRAIAAQRQLSVGLLTWGHDIDRPEDLPRWMEVQKRSVRPSISVIIPVFNEAERLPLLLAALQKEPLQEIIVVDGGSSDQTMEVAKTFPVCVLSGPRGRAFQMNLGASRARGDILLFLHSDSMVPSGLGLSIREVLSRPGVSLGAFGLTLDQRGWWLEQVTRWANWRARVLGWPYGDQGLFLDRGFFQQVGGFKPLPIMEDYELVRVCKKRGSIAVASQSISTSARRWRQLGVVRTTIINQAMVLGYRVGLPIVWLVKLYHGQRQRPK